jgi:hypothetical protein
MSECEVQAERWRFSDKTSRRNGNLVDDAHWGLICDCGELHMGVSREVWSVDERGLMVTVFTHQDRSSCGLGYRLREAWDWVRGHGYNEISTILVGLELEKLHELTKDSGWKVTREKEG